MQKPNTDKLADKTFMAKIEAGHRLASITIPASVARAIFGIDPSQTGAFSRSLYGIAVGDALQLNARKPDLCIPPLVLSPESFIPLDEANEKHP
jgi:hypothetical protein